MCHIAISTVHYFKVLYPRMWSLKYISHLRIFGKTIAVRPKDLIKFYKTILQFFFPKYIDFKGVSVAFASDFLTRISVEKKMYKVG